MLELSLLVTWVFINSKYFMDLVCINSKYFMDLV